MSVVHFVDTPQSLEWLSAVPGESATLTVTQPDGTTANPTVTNKVLTHTTAFTPSKPGRHTLLWATPTETFSDVLDVWPTDPHYLVSRADAMKRLKINALTSAHDALMLYVASASSVVESITGPLIADERRWTEVIQYPVRAIILPAYDITVTAVTVDGTALTESDYTVDEDAGIVWSDAFDGNKIVVNYTVGADQIPPAARQACLEIIAHMWQLTQQNGRPIVAQEGTMFTPTGFAIPDRAHELLQHLPRPAGTA